MDKCATACRGCCGGSCPGTGCTAARSLPREIYRNDSLESSIIAHSVFPGIELIYTDAHTMSLLRADGEGDVLEITYCREGRTECSMNGGIRYIERGDLLIKMAETGEDTCYYPLSHYHGVTVRIDIAKAPACLSCLLKDVDVEPAALAKKFCAEKGGFIARSNPSVEHIFSELYSVPEAVRKGYFKVKILELLLFLSALDPADNEQNSRSCTKAQADLAKNISRYLTDNMDVHITLEQLAERFFVSVTHLKNSFKKVYGVSVYSYIRRQKMQSAAAMLRNTDRSIMEIAGEHGYDNGSKFASAFKDEMGATPREYRASKK